MPQQVFLGFPSSFLGVCDVLGVWCMVYTSFSSDFLFYSEMRFSFCDFHPQICIKVALGEHTPPKFLPLSDFQLSQLKHRWHHPSEHLNVI